MAVNRCHSERYAESPLLRRTCCACAASPTHPRQETGMKRISSSVFSLLLLVLVSTSAFAQARRVSGRVTVEGSGEGVAAASVNVVGTSLGTYTDDQGRFSLNVPDGPVVLRIRRIGYT